MFMALASTTETSTLAPIITVMGSLVEVMAS